MVMQGLLARSTLQNAEMQHCVQQGQNEDLPQSWRKTLNFSDGLSQISFCVAEGLCQSASTRALPNGTQVIPQGGLSELTSSIFKLPNGPVK